MSDGKFFSNGNYKRTKKECNKNSFAHQLWDQKEIERRGFRVITLMFCIVIDKKYKNFMSDGKF